MYKVIEIKGAEITNYQGIIVSVLRHEYCYGMWHLTCLVEEKDTLSPDPETESLNEKPEVDSDLREFDTFSFHAYCEHYFKEHCPFVKELELHCSIVHSAMAGKNICYCEFTFDETKMAIIYDYIKWKLAVNQVVESSGKTIEECCDYLWTRIKEN